MTETPALETTEFTPIPLKIHPVRGDRISENCFVTETPALPVTGRPRLPCPTPDRRQQRTRMTKFRIDRHTLLARPAAADEQREQWLDSKQIGAVHRRRIKRAYSRPDQGHPELPSNPFLGARSAGQILVITPSTPRPRRLSIAARARSGAKCSTRERGIPGSRATSVTGRTTSELRLLHRATPSPNMRRWRRSTRAHMQE